MSGSGWDCPGGTCDWLEVEQSPSEGGREMEASPPSTASFPAPGGAEDGGSWQGLVLDDNVDGSAYLSYLRGLDPEVSRYRLAAWDGPLHTFRVANSAGAPVLGATIEITGPNGGVVATRVSHADGRAEWGAPEASGPFTVRVRKDLASVEQQIDPTQPRTDITLDALTGAEAPKVDVLFLIDATASMADVLTRVSADVATIEAGVRALPGAPTVRYGLTVFRDREESFLTRTFNFTANSGTFVQALGEVRATGGGDTPEALDAGLRDALVKPAWGGGGTIKLVVVIGDAPPHADGGSAPNALEVGLESANTQGVSIIGIAAPGADGAAVATFRQMARRTRGSFVGLAGPGAGQSRSDPAFGATANAASGEPLPVASILVAQIGERLAALQG